MGDGYPLISDPNVYGIFTGNLENVNQPILKIEAVLSDGSSYLRWGDGEAANERVWLKSAEGDRQAIIDIDTSGIRVYEYFSTGAKQKYRNPLISFFTIDDALKIAKGIIHTAKEA